MLEVALWKLSIFAGEEVAAGCYHFRCVSKLLTVKCEGAAGLVKPVLLVATLFLQVLDALVKADQRVTHLIDVELRAVSIVPIVVGVQGVAVDVGLNSGHF